MTSVPPTPPDEPFDRLRATDPAAGVEPDTEALGAAVAARTGHLAEGHGAPDSVPGGPATGAADELAARRRRLPWGARWTQVAAGVAALAVVGAGGFALGAGQGGADQSATGSSLPAPVQLGGASAQVTSGAASSADGLALAESRKIAGFGGRAVYTGVGLSTEGGVARAWGFDAASTYSAETAGRIAQALGVEGDLVQEWGSWRVGPNDGSGPTVQVQPDGLTSVSYYDPTIQAGQCMDMATSPSGATADTGQPDTMEQIAPAPGGGACESGEPAPGAEQAIERTRELLRALGVDDAGYEVTIGESWTTELASVTAERVLDGQRTGIAWNVTLAAGGEVQSLHGALAPMVDLGELEVISPADAVARLADPRFGGSWGGGVMPLLRADQGMAVPEMGIMPVEPEWTVPPTPRAGDPLPWAVTEVTLTSARLGIGMTTLDDGSTVLLPSYELSDDSGSTWSVVAVADAHLDFTPAG
ncbi:hypothetical protein [Cellulomonas chengniuliangii]|uniref:hypothetical protein n=1 Tax=Cellulomonas chengniuliangii TaxID=2968084 RepID=UPI001D0EE570|nr:hypothetical protein [Cellulomonas chengniuliangii]